MLLVDLAIILASKLYFWSFYVLSAGCTYALESFRNILQGRALNKIESVRRQTNVESEAITDEHHDYVQEIEDIDQFDARNPQLVSDYAKDTFEYLRQLEKNHKISPSFLSDKTITPEKRATLVDWLIRVHFEFNLIPETLYVCIQLVDSYLMNHDVSDKQIKLVGLTALFVAYKYEETYLSEEARKCRRKGIDDFVRKANNLYTKSDIRLTEINMLMSSSTFLSKPIPLAFLRRSSKAGDATAKQHILAKYFMELSLYEAAFSSTDPSYLAASALCLSFKLLGAKWDHTLIFYTSYKEEDLRSGMKQLAKLVIKAGHYSYPYQYVNNKYNTEREMRVSKLAVFSSETMKRIATGEHFS